jgi:hypothetical protein
MVYGNTRKICDGPDTAWIFETSASLVFLHGKLETQRRRCVMGLHELEASAVHDWWVCLPEEAAETWILQAAAKGMN